VDVTGDEELPEQPTLQNCMKKDSEKTAKVSLAIQEIEEQHQTRLNAPEIDNAIFKDLLTQVVVIYQDQHSETTRCRQPLRKCCPGHQKYFCPLINLPAENSHHRKTVDESLADQTKEVQK